MGLAWPSLSLEHHSIVNCRANNKISGKVMEFIQIKQNENRKNLTKCQCFITSTKNTIPNLPLLWMRSNPKGQ